MQNPAPKVMIRTLALSNGNYGGILQAYALQKALRDLGFSPATDISQPDFPVPNGKYIAQDMKALVKTLAVQFSAVAAKRPKWVRDYLTKKTDVRLMDFCARHIATTRLYDASGRPDSAVANSFDALVVGSDQVWRAKYSDVESCLFNFAQDSSVPKVAYAASFGLETIDEEYGEALIERTAALAKKFDAISVREESGVAICAEKWGVPAIQLIDPTMLVDAEHYIALAAHSEVKTPTNGLLAYILDTSPEVVRWTADMARTLGHSVHSLMPDVPHTIAEFHANPAAFVRPSVYRWLQAIQQADCVITDSFHGTVFAILLERPFLVVKNKERGSARFDTLLGIFGLQDRAVEVGQDAATRMLEPIDWERVRGLLALKRQTALEFLQNALSKAKRASAA